MDIAQVHRHQIPRYPMDVIMVTLVIPLPPPHRPHLHHLHHHRYRRHPTPMDPMQPTKDKSLKPNDFLVHCLILLAIYRLRSAKEFMRSSSLSWWVLHVDHPHLHVNPSAALLRFSAAVIRCVTFAAPSDGLVFFFSQKFLKEIKRNG